MIISPFAWHFLYLFSCYVTITSIHHPVNMNIDILGHEICSNLVLEYVGAVLVVTTNLDSVQCDPSLGLLMRVVLVPENFDPA